MTMYFKGDACQALGYCSWTPHGDHGHCDFVSVCDALNASNIEISEKEGVCGETNQCHWDATSTTCVSGADSVHHDYTDEQKTDFCMSLAYNDMSMYFKGDACQALGYCLWVSHGNHGHCDFITVCDALNASSIESSLKEGVCGETNQCHWDATSTTCVSGADSVPHNYTDDQKTAFCGAIASNDMTMYFKGDACQALEYCSWTPHGDHGHCDFVSVCDALNASSIESSLKEGICGETNQCHWDASSTTCVSGAASVPYNYTDEIKAAFCGAIASNDMTMYFKGDACQALGYCSWTPHGDHGHCDFVSVCDALNASSIESSLKEGVCGETNQCHWDATSTTCVSDADSVHHAYTDEQKTAFCGAIASNDMTMYFKGDACQALGYCSWTPHGDHGHCDFVSVCDALNASNIEISEKEGVCGETNQCHWDTTSTACISGADSIHHDYTDEQKTDFCLSLAYNDMTMYFKGDACQALGYCLWVSHGNHGHCDFITVCDALNASSIENSLKEGVCGETNQCHWDATSTTCVSGADSVHHDYTDEQKTA
ncbi:MAG: hypothetical protein KVP17_003133, partial [Porospora cf. gigantea B]